MLFVGKFSDSTRIAGCAWFIASSNWSWLRGRASSLGLPARISGLASQTISWLTTARVPVTQTIRTKNQMGRASQLWTRNQSLERDFFDMRLTVGFGDHACGPWVAGRCSRSVHLYRTYEPERT